MKKGKGKIQTKFNKKRDKKNKGHKKKKKTKKIKSGKPTGIFYRVNRIWRKDKNMKPDDLPARRKMGLKSRLDILELNEGDLVELRGKPLRSEEVVKKRKFDSLGRGRDVNIKVPKRLVDKDNKDLQWVKVRKDWYEGRKKKNKIGWIPFSLLKSHMDEISKKKPKKDERVRDWTGGIPPNPDLLPVELLELHPSHIIEKNPRLY